MRALTRTAQTLAAAVGAGGHTWHAYLSTRARPGQPAVNARDRIGTGPWFSWSFARLGHTETPSFPADLGELHGDTLVQAQRGDNLFKQSTRNQRKHGEVIHGIDDTPQIQHEILTGSKWDGRLTRTTHDQTRTNMDQQLNRFRTSRPFRSNRQWLLVEVGELHKGMQPGRSGKHWRQSSSTTSQSTDAHRDKGSLDCACVVGDPEIIRPASPVKSLRPNWSTRKTQLSKISFYPALSGALSKTVLLALHV